METPIKMDDLGVPLFSETLNILTSLSWPFFYSTEGHQSAVFKANFMQFSKLIWYYLM